MFLKFCFKWNINIDLYIIRESYIFNYKSECKLYLKWNKILNIFLFIIKMYLYYFVNYKYFILKYKIVVYIGMLKVFW